MNMHIAFAASHRNKNATTFYSVDSVKAITCKVVKDGQTHTAAQLIGMDETLRLWLQVLLDQRLEAPLSLF